MPELVGIHYKEYGSGEPVLLLHGFCETHFVWDHIARDISDSFHIIAIDLPGFGKSTSLVTPFTIAAVAEQILAFLKEKNIQAVSVIGHSLGGYVTLAMAKLAPKNIKSFGLFQSTAFADSDEKKLSRNKVIEFVEAHGVQPFIESFIPPLFHNPTNPHIPEIVKLALTTPKDTLIAYTQAMRDRPDNTRILSDFQGKILLIGGENDTVIPKDAIIKQAKMVHNATTIFYPNTGHMAMFEVPEKVTRDLRNFLK